MEKFNNTSVFTGYLKQLLHNYNLPKYKVYTKEQQKYFDKNGKEREDVLQTVTKTGDDFPVNLHYIPYIRHGRIQEYINGEWVSVGTRGSSISHTHDYTEGIKILNYTKNLKIKNNVYDSYTHEYLGDYLRFQRDYNNIDLMPLYNCFSDRACDMLDISFIRSSEQEDQSKTTYLLADINNNADILDNNSDSELAVAIPETSAQGTRGRSNSGLTDFVNNLNIKTKFITVTKQNIELLKSSLDPDETPIYVQTPAKPLKVSFNTDDANYKIYMMPIKLFKEYTIAIDSDSPIEFCCGLYGAYQNKQDKFSEIPSKTYKKLMVSKFNKPFLYSEFKQFCQNSTASELTELSQTEDDIKLFIKVPQTNTSTIVILEGNYLTWNDRIFNAQAKPIQNTAALNFENFDSTEFDCPLFTSLQLLQFNTGNQHPFADRLMEYLLGNAITPVDELPKNVMRIQKAVTAGTADNPYYNYKVKDTGFWDNEFKYIFYDYINEENNTTDINHDILGYVDKDVEKYYCYLDKNNKPVSLLNTEVSEEDM